MTIRFPDYPKARENIAVASGRMRGNKERHANYRIFREKCQTISQ